MELENDLIIRAAKGFKIERTPVWLMRQAGRVLPEYLEVRKQARSFKDLVKNPQLASQVTIQPVDILDVDAAIIFSDILVIPEAMGLNYEMAEKEGPYFNKVISSDEDVENLKIINPAEDLAYVLEAIHLTKIKLAGRVPIIGFAGAPWTIFSYITEGKGSKTFSKSRKLLYTEPDLSHKLLQKITDNTISYLQAQIEAGADMVQIFDSWAGILSPEQYEEFSLQYIAKICSSITNVPVVVFAKGAYYALESLGKLNCRVIGLDWNMEIKKSRQIIGHEKTLQGNLDPCALYGSYKTIYKSVRKMIDSFGHQRHIANLGHGLYPDTEVAKVKYFVKAVKEYSLHRATLEED